MVECLYIHYLNIDNSVELSMLDDIYMCKALCI